MSIKRKTARLFENIAERFSEADGTKLMVIIVCSILGLTLIIGGIFLYFQNKEMRSATRITDLASGDLDTSPLANNPDFNALQKKYPDIVGWIYIPNTNVDYPIVQCPGDDYYYINHSATGIEDKMGAIFIESYNSPNLEDQINVLYGHNGVDTSMFTTLHFYENAEFFEKNDRVYVYTPNHKYTYRVITTFIYDDRHILTAYDYGKEDQKRLFLYNLKNSGVASNVRYDMPDPTIDDKVIILSTCMTNTAQTNERFLVNGILIDDEEL